MKSLAVLVLALIAFFLTILSSDSAAVRSEEFAEQLQRIVHDMYPGSLRTERGTNSEADQKSKRNCYNNEPCGWTTYYPDMRISTHFMPNMCKCPDDSYKCVRQGVNVAMRAYGYYCRQNTTAEDIESPSDGEFAEYGS